VTTKISQRDPLEEIRKAF
jgi:centrin-3